MPKISSALKAQLNACTSKQQYADTIKTALGATPHIRCFRDANSAATDPALTGTEFLNMTLDGSFQIVAGNIVSFGKATAITVRNAADLSTGASELRLEGNGHSITYSLGLTNSGKEFTLPSSPTGAANVGFAFAKGSGTKSPMSLNSGTGPVVPTLDANAPYSVTIENWTSGAAVPVGTIIFDTRKANWIFDDLEVASNMGDVRVDSSSTTVTYGDHEFGAMRFIMTGQMNSESSAPVYQVLIGIKPTASNWPNYPAYSGYTKATTDTFPGPFKAVIKTQAGVILKTHEMRDGLPINSPQLHDDDDFNFPLRPHMNCAQMLPWQSARPKKNTYANKWFPGVSAAGYRPTACRAHFSSNQAMPFMNWDRIINGCGQWWMLPKWPFPSDPAKQTSDTNQDPNLTGAMSTTTNWADSYYASNNAWRMTGWGYEPGAFGPMDQTYGPGGSRANRMVIGTPYAIYLTNPNFVRPRNNDAIAEMIDHHNLHFFNMGMYWFQDVKNFGTIPINEVLQGVWGGGKTYYGGNDSYVVGGNAKSIPFFAISAGSGIQAGPHKGMHTDKNGRAPWNSFAFDWEHNYDSPGMVAAFLGSPMHAVAAKHRFIASQMAQVSWTLPGSVSGMFMARDHAWRWLHLVHAWKLGSDHELGITRQGIEDYMEADLNALYDVWYKPAFVDGRQQPQDILLKNMGVAAGYSQNNGTWGHTAHGITFYLGGVMGLMKQYGMYKRMADKSEKCKRALEMVIRNLDYMAIEFILKFNGRNPNYNVFTDNVGLNPVFVKTWDELNTRDPRNGLEDWTSNPAGDWIGERADTEHMRAQWVSIRKNVFPELPYDGTADGINLAYQAYKAHYDKAVARLAETPPKSDFTYLWAGFAEWLPPTVVEP